MRAWLLPALLASAAVAEDDLPIHVYPAPRAAAPPVIDGRLDEAIWSQAPVVSGFVWYDRLEPLAVQTAFGVAWDDQALYLGVRCDEPSMDKLTPLPVPRDAHQVFGTEALEFFLEPAHDHALYYQWAANAAGSLYDSRLTDPAFQSDATAATQAGEQGWTLEVRLPWAPLGFSPEQGRLLGFNVCRDRTICRPASGVAGRRSRPTSTIRSGSPSRPRADTGAVGGVGRRVSQGRPHRAAPDLRQGRRRRPDLPRAGAGGGGASGAGHRRLAADGSSRTGRGGRGPRQAPGRSRGAACAVAAGGRTRAGRRHLRPDRTGSHGPRTRTRRAVVAGPARSVAGWALARPDGQRPQPQRAKVEDTSGVVALQCDRSAFGTEHAAFASGGALDVVRFGIVDHYSSPTKTWMRWPSTRMVMVNHCVSSTGERSRSTMA